MVLIRLRKVALTVAARCSGVAPSIGVFYQDGRPNGGRSVTRTGRGDSYMDDPRSELESNQIFSIKRRGHTLRNAGLGRPVGYADTPLDDQQTMICISGEKTHDVNHQFLIPSA